MIISQDELMMTDKYWEDMLLTTMEMELIVDSLRRRLTDESITPAARVQLDNLLSRTDYLLTERKKRLLED